MPSNYDPQNSKVHESEPNYGTHTFEKLAEKISELFFKKHIYTFLDYGCGKGNFIQKCKQLSPVDSLITGYDPAIKQYSQLPDHLFDLVTCIYVLEHIETHEIDYILRAIRRRTKKFSFLIIDLLPAIKSLSDGRNAHVLLAPAEWWLAKIYSYYGSILTVPIFHEKSNLISSVAFACTVDLKYLPIANSLLYTWLSFNAFDKSKRWNKVKPIQKDAERINRII